MTDDRHPFLTLYCSHCGKPLKVRLSCGDRTCPTCRKKWFGYHFDTILKIVSGWTRVYFMTLTVRNIPDRSFGRFHVDYLRRDFGKLRRKVKVIAGGFYVVQVTNAGSGWHLHLHVIYDGSYVHQKKLSRLWCDITSGSWIVGIREVQDRKKAVAYLLRDFLQTPKIRPEDAEAFNSIFRGSRLVQPFGLYRKTKFRIPYECPDCGDSSWALLEQICSGIYGKKKKKGSGGSGESGGDDP